MAGKTKYTQEIADKLCDLISSSNRGVAFHCKDKSVNVAPSTIYKWLSENKPFSEQYARAREAQADFLAEEILEISDHSDKDTVIIYDKAGNAIPVEDKEWTNRSRLRVESRKWLAGKLKPKKYGDKLDIEQTIHIEQPLFPDKTT